MLRSLAEIGDALLFLGAAAALVWFLWHLVLRRIYRARHIRKLQMDRLMREAAQRPPDPAKRD